MRGRAGDGEGVVYCAAGFYFTDCSMLIFFFS